MTGGYSSLYRRTTCIQSSFPPVIDRGLMRNLHHPRVLRDRQLVRDEMEHGADAGGEIALAHA
jgi:hypothetical protein